MGNGFEFTAIHLSLANCKSAVDAAIAEVKRIEQFLSTYNENSEVNQINANAGIAPAVVSDELIQLIIRACHLSKLTQGAFDITYGSVDKRLWNFDQTMTELPDAEIAKASVSLVNYKNIIIDEDKSTIFLKNEGMRIGFGGIGKGYAAECAKAIMLSMGIHDGAINAAGDLTVWGRQQNGDKWQVGISNPDAKDQYFTKIGVDSGAVATSGNYEKYIIINGQKYSHTINPKTGLPITGIKSASIICPNAELADALTTPVMVMGVEAGLHLINQLRDVSCIIVDDDDVIHTSKNLRSFIPKSTL